MAHDLGESGGLVLAPLFPLPNVVLFPHAVLPLHIFEERYKAMTDHVLAGDKVLAMAMLEPGWEKDYYGLPAIAPVVCVGKILSHERLADGCFNFLLMGVRRARARRETQRRPFRIAELELIGGGEVGEKGLGDFRRRLLAVFERGPFAATPIARQFRQIFADQISTADAADLIAFNFLDDISLKQQLLAELDVAQRITRLLSALEADPPPATLNLAPGEIVLPMHDDPSLN